MIFNTVSDDSSITDTYLSAMGLAGKTLDLPALVNDGTFKKETIPSTKIGGKASEIYTIDRDKVEAAVSNLSTSLIDDPSSYTYANSIWQDKINGQGTLKQALGEDYKNREAVLKQIRNYYVDEAIKKANLEHGVSVQLPKPEKGSYYKTDIQLRALAKNPEKTISVNGKNYKIEKGYIIPQKLDLSLDPPGFVDDTENKFPLHNVDKKGNKTLNYSDFRALTGDTIRIKN